MATESGIAFTRRARIGESGSRKIESGKAPPPPWGAPRGQGRAEGKESRGESRGESRWKSRGEQRGDLAEGDGKQRREQKN
jgi:hypothetical protein